MWYNSRRHLLFLLSLSIVSLIFAVGQSSPLTLGLTQWMIDYLPLWQGYREPQKWTGIIVLVESILFLMAVVYIYKRYVTDKVMGGAVFFALLMVLYIWSP
ncbi:MAG: hypothetical protein WAW59_07080 [Patescibacteria group bacterium]